MRRDVRVARGSRAATATLLSLGVAACAATAVRPRSFAKHKDGAPFASPSTSIGAPEQGRVEGAIALPDEAPGLFSNPSRPNPDARFGTSETIAALLRAAAVVNEELPGSRVVINDIGLREGGPIHHHGSHQAGRDVDVLFYYLDRSGAPWPAKGVPVDPRGRGWDFANLSDGRDDVPVRLDVARTWRFVRALLDEPEPASPVQRIFLVEHVRTLLLAEADRVRAPRAIRNRFADVTCQPGYPHDDHLHVRFFCSAEDIQRGCEDAAPMYPWRRSELQALGLEPMIARRPPRHSARERTGVAPVPPRLHSRVIAFLDARRAWLPQPHPGRRYCP